MKKCNFIICFILLIICISTTAQNDVSNNRIIAKIDSIAKVKNIEEGVVMFNRLKLNNGTYGLNGQNESYKYSLKQKFEFDGPFIVFNESYFNIEKLLYFVVWEDYFEFHFQDR